MVRMCVGACGVVVCGACVAYVRGVCLFVCLCVHMCVVYFMVLLCSTVLP